MHRLPFKHYAVLASVALCAAFGEALLKHGMTQVGEISAAEWTRLLTAFLNPFVILGVLLLIGFFASYLTALSWADLTYVMPATAAGYVVTAIIARFVFAEHISPARWAGIALITIGVGFVTRGPSLTVESDMVEGSRELSRIAGAR